MALWQEKDYGIIADRACWAMFAVATLVVGLRVFCRVRYGSNKLGGGLGLDDYITLGCMVVFLATCILVTLGSSHGLGRHMAALEEEGADIAAALKYNVIISAVLIWTFSLPKFAIISVLKRILNYGTKTTILFWGLALSSQACIFATSVWWFEQCTPVAYGWDQTIPGGKCTDVSVLADLGYFTSAYSAFLDIFFALYPIPFIMRLNMPLRTRVAVATALGLSVMACVVSIYKLTIFGQVFAILAVDPTYPVPYLDILGVSEGFVLLVCASLPALGPLFRAAKGKVTSATRTAQGSHNQLDSGEVRSHGGSRNWDSFKGHKLEDAEHSSTLNLRPSFDAIPLVTTSKGKDYNKTGIHKTMEVSVSSESFEDKSQRAASAV
ncbi:Integral membrane protein [Pleurostoma richardsiae]|uniref:Integral membrane protein n=1 Tax=Pleurostoma richardsiae TaxID=41990 RepID=A0AA38RPE6_9PEZI|nr:Integral membrane protein [Pleurostoma richardsiae]